MALSLNVNIINIYKESMYVYIVYIHMYMFISSLFNLQESTASPLHGTSHSKVPSGLICVAASSQIKKPQEDSSLQTSCKGITLVSLTTTRKVFDRDVL